MIFFLLGHWVGLAVLILASLPFLAVPRRSNGEGGFIWFLAALVLSPPVAFFLVRDFSKP